MKKLKKNKY